MTMENQKTIIIRTPPIVDEIYRKTLDDAISNLQQNFPDRKIIEIPANIAIEFLNN